MFSCGICGSSDILSEKILDEYPLTNIYTATYDASQKYCFDAVLRQCKCGHVQLSSDCDSSSIYAIDYPYNGEAVTVRARRNRGVDLINKHLSGTELNCIVDIGCGQLSMIKKLGERFNHRRLIAMDPVPLRTNVEIGKIEFINDYFTGQLNINENSDCPSLFVLDNVLEHIQDLRSFIDSVLKNTKIGDFVYVCVPSFDVICEKLQFNEIIHEHVHYFMINELNDFFNEHGFHTIESFSNQDDGRAYNFHIFTRAEGRQHSNILINNSTKLNLSSSIHTYSEILKACRNSIESINAPVWGVCASELTPTLAYFMKSDIGFCRGIFDTSSHKSGKYMTGIRPIIMSMDEISKLDFDCYFFITAPNLVVPVINNLKKLNAKNFITPSFFL